MQENQCNNNDPYRDYQPDPEWRMRMRIVMLLSFGLWILWAICTSLPDPKEFWTIFIGGSVNLFILAAMLVQAHVSKRQWEAMQEALERTDILIDQNKKIIEAANKQVDTAFRQFELTDRPWLSVDVRFAQPLTFDENGANLAFLITAKNIGRSVAINTTIHAKIVTPNIGTDIYETALKEQLELCQNIGFAFMQTALFPEKSQSISWGSNVSQDVMEESRSHIPDLLNLKIIIFFLVGCVDYQISGHDKHHQTRFIYEVRSTDGILEVGKRVPLDYLTLVKPVLGTGDYAD